MPWARCGQRASCRCASPGARSGRRERVAGGDRGGRARRLRARLSARAFGRHAHARLDRARARHRAATCCCSTSRSPRSTRSRASSSTRICCGCGRAAADHPLRHAQRLRIRVPVEPHRRHDPAPRPGRRRCGGRSAVSARARAAHAPAYADLRRAARASSPRRCAAVAGLPHAPRRCARLGGRRPAASASSCSRCGRWWSGSRPFRPTSCRGRSWSRRRCGPTGRAFWARSWSRCASRWRRWPRRRLLGGALALLFALSRLLERCLFPYAVILQVTPIVAIAPLIIIWVNSRSCRCWSAPGSSRSFRSSPTPRSG